MKITLYAPQEYWYLSEKAKKQICNGCGAKGSFLAKIIPQGKFREACNIHDYMYAIGKTDEDKKIADRVFINNLNRIVEASSPFLRPFRKLLALSYYKAVAQMGDEAFWRNKVYPGMVGKRIEL